VMGIGGDGDVIEAHADGAPVQQSERRTRIFHQTAAVQNAAICVGVKPPAASPQQHGSRVALTPIGPLAATWAGASSPGRSAHHRSNSSTSAMRIIWPRALRIEIHMAYHLDTWKGCDRNPTQSRAG